MKCNVVLYSDDKTQDFSYAGELILSGNHFTLSYNFGGESCLLTYDGKVLKHRKSGEIPVSIEFIENENTLCKIGEGEFLGEIPVYTDSLNVRVSDGKVLIEVAYGLGGESKKMKISAKTVN